MNSEFGMRNCKKVLLLLLLCACLLLTGCHGAQDKDAFLLPTSFDESRTYDITFWAKTESNVTQANIYKDAIEKFQQIYPNIRVNLKLYTDYGRIYQDVITNIATNSTPNVCITYPDHIATYLTGNNCVVPLDTRFADSQYGLDGSALRFDGETLILTDTAWHKEGAFWAAARRPGELRFYGEYDCSLLRGNDSWYYSYVTAEEYPIILK